ncbi:SAM domain-containing protein [Nesterenkonia suensis]
MHDFDPSITDPELSLTERLHMAGNKQQVQQWMRSLGLEDYGPSNFPVAVEAVTRGIRVSASRRGTMLLSLDGERYTWRGGATSLNHRLARLIARRKDVQGRLFKSAGVPFPENCAFDEGQVERAWDWAHHVLPVVVKPVNGRKGQDVFVNVTDRQAFDAAFAQVARTWGSVLVEQFNPGSEHRLHVVDGTFTAALVMRPANVTGDGSSTIEELVATKNRAARSSHRQIRHREIRLESVELASLDALGLSPSSVLEAERTVYLRRNSNLSTGGDSLDATDDIRPEEIRIAEEAAKACPGMRCVGLDLLLPRREGDGPPTIIEANTAAGIGGHHFPRYGSHREVTVPILNAMFPQTTRDYPTPPAAHR